MTTTAAAFFFLALTGLFFWANLKSRTRAMRGATFFVAWASSLAAVLLVVREVLL